MPRVLRADVAKRGKTALSRPPSPRTTQLRSEILSQCCCLRDQALGPCMGQRLSHAVEGSVLAEASASNEVDVVTQILDNCPRAILYKTLFKRRTPLMLAAEQGAVESTLKLLWAAERTLQGQAAYQAYIDEADAKNNTALTLACKHGHAVCARLLLEDSASPLPANSRGDTALHLAANRGHAACVDLLLRAWVRSPSGNTVRAADALVVDGRFGEERYVDTHNKAGLAALHLAVLGRSVESAAVLIHSGASPDVPVLRGLQLRVPYLCGGSTPLHIAAFQGDVRMCLVLLEGQWRHPGVELRRLRNARGLTPLNCALLAGHHDLARVLVESRMPGPVLTLSRRALDYQFPDTLRHHLLGILHRASLLVQLREISKQWRDQGLGKPSDDSVKMVGLAELRPGSIARLTQLVQREGASLRDIITGLEEAFSPGTAAATAAAAAAAAAPPMPTSTPAASAAVPGSSGSPGSAADAAGAGSTNTSTRAVVGGGLGDEAEARSESESSEGEGGRGGRRRRGHVRSRRRESRRSEREGDAGVSRSRDVDWTILEAQRMLSLDPWGMSLSRRRTRGRRSARRASSVDGGDGPSSSIPQAVLEVQHSAGSVMPPHRRRLRSREAREQVLSELIESVHSAEAVLAASGTRGGQANEGPVASPANSSAAASAEQHPLHRHSSAPLVQQETAGHVHGGDAGRASSSDSSSAADSEAASRGQDAGSEEDKAAPGECAICFDAISDVAVAGCGHGMCFVCACKMVARSSQEHPTCPFCRAPIKEFQRMTGVRQKTQPTLA